MNNLYKIFLFIISIHILTSCEDILDKQPLDIMSDAVVWEDEVLIDAYLTEQYAQMYVFSNETGGDDHSGNGELWFAPYVVNNVSDECKANWWKGLGMQKKYGTLNVTGGLLEWWEQAYVINRALNIFIEKIKTAPVNENFRVQRSAEARFLRAFNYFYLVKRYGGVPIITEAKGIDDEGIYVERDKEQDVYDFILSEMAAIKNDLPEANSKDDYGRPTQYVALALRCRAALYAASIAKYGTIKLEGLVGIDNAKASEYYQMAYDAAYDIIKSDNFELYDEQEDKAVNFQTLFLTKNKEVMFVKQHNSLNKGDGGNGWAYDFMQTPLPNAWGGGNQDGVYLEMVEEFEYLDGTPGKLDTTEINGHLWTTDLLWKNKDPRFFASIYTMNTLWNGAPIDWHYGVRALDGSLITSGSYEGVLANGNQRTSNGTGFGVKKYLKEGHDVMTARGTSDQAFIMFRYGEVLLNYAEAAFELGGEMDEALWAVDEIRARAGIATLQSMGKPITLEAIRHERKVELAFEGHRYWDLRRWRTAENELSRTFSGLRHIYDYATGKLELMVIENVDGENNIPAFYEQNYYLPITIARTGINPNLIENPGY
ncbi:RagB/SusD family nutrient uptake outer membrane protein [Carboxylicivirga sp. RSCT41]|uniref:RagB/SusD family nutrient uptake outer membrane protein n=1 Tax=Carboxylicivirga agarovorans TaxID=3417570 RepID=UPI003D349A7E